MAEDHSAGHSTDGGDAQARQTPQGEQGYGEGGAVRPTERDTGFP